jgi:hypothetical protein
MKEQGPGQMVAQDQTTERLHNGQRDGCGSSNAQSHKDKNQKRAEQGMPKEEWEMKEPPHPAGSLVAIPDHQLRQGQPGILAGGLHEKPCDQVRGAGVKGGL